MQNINQKQDFLSFKSAIVGAALALLIALPVGYKYVQYMVDQQPSQQFVVIDYLEMVSELSDDASDKESVNKATTLLSETIKRLSDAGFVVLDSRAVLSAPNSFYVADKAIKDLSQQ